LLVLPVDLPIGRESDTWSAYYNFDQALYVDPCDAQRNWGVFGRAGWGDEESNPVEWFLSFGLGGTGPIDCRPRDTWGVGWYRIGVSDAIPQVLADFRDSSGVEAFYNAEVTPWFHLTFDVQYIAPGFQGIPALGIEGPDDAVVVGLRGKIDF
jgi:porin